MKRPLNPPTRAHGAATLPVVLLLSLAAVLAVVHAHRDIVSDLRSTANQARTAQAHEAAQAGIAWAIAWLNRPERVDENCEPSALPSASAWQERTEAPAVPAPPAAPPSPTPTLHASCVADGLAWSCHCPAEGPARDVVDASVPAFRISLSPVAGEPDRWSLESTGHSGQGGVPILLWQDIGKLPGLDTLPAAALTVRGAARFSAGHVTVANTDGAGSGLTVHAGADIVGPALAVAGPPGTPATATVLGEDPVLAGLSVDALHASLFRLDRDAWRAQPGVREVDCHTPCDAALSSAAAQHTMIFLAGGLRLAGATSLGSPERPVLLVADGPVELQGGATVQGLVLALHAPWHDPVGSRIQGAVVAAHDLHAQGNTRIEHDTRVLRQLQRRAGTFAPRLGGWRDL